MRTIKTLHHMSSYFTDNMLKPGDLIRIPMTRNFQELERRARQGGGLLEYVPPTDNDYKYSMGGMAARVVKKLDRVTAGRR